MKTKQLTRLLLGLSLLVLLGAICAKPPDIPAAPVGPSQGQEGIAYACTTSTTDPGGSQVAYQFDWGDETQSAWSGLMAGGTPYADTHTFTQSGQYSIRSRAKNEAGKASDWSEPLYVYINPGEGELRWRFSYTYPDDPEDSADFSLNTFGIGTDGAAYIGCEYGAAIRRSPTGARKWYPSPEEDEFYGTPSIGPDSTVYIGCANDSLYALTPSMTRKWTAFVGDEVTCGAAIGNDGAIFVQNLSDSLFCIEPNGARRWRAWTGGGYSSPVIGPDGTVYAASQEGWLYAFNPADGSPKGSYNLSSQQINSSPAIDVSRNVIYIADEEGRIARVSLADMQADWSVRIGFTPSSPVIGTDGTVFIGSGGKLYALNPDDGGIAWSYEPPMTGTVSSPAVTQDGWVYALVTLGKKDYDFPDSLYAVDPGGTRRWATALGEGSSDEVFSAPKLDEDGNIHIASGLVAWCVRGISPPAQSSWPQFQHDPQNTGRARQ